jgi:hypothetical protein
MKVKLVLNGQQIVEGATAEEIVEQMAGLNWPDPDQKPATVDDYMREVSERVKIQKGAPVRYDTAEHFLEDLEAAGAIARIE